MKVNRKRKHSLIPPFLDFSYIPPYTDTSIINYHPSILEGFDILHVLGAFR